MASLLTIALACLGCFLVIVVVAFILWKLHIRKWSSLPLAKGCIPFLGHVHLMNGKSADAFTEWCYDFTENNGPTFLFFFFWKPVIFTKDVQLGKTLLSSQKYITKSKQLDLLKEWLGLGLLTGTGQLWKDRRRLITPAFHLDILSSNIPLLEKQATDLVGYINDSIGDDKTVKFTNICRLFALGAICEFAMGVPMKLCTRNPEPSAKRFSECSEELLLAINKRFINPLYRPAWIFRHTKLGKKYYENLNIFNAFVKSVVEERINIHNQSNQDKAKIFIDILFDAYQKNQIDIQGMMDEVNTFIFAGNETISINLAWVIFYLGKHGDIQEKLFEELVSYKKKNASMKEVLTDAVYLDCVIKETQRISSVNQFARHIEEDTEMNGLSVPANTEIILLAHNIQLDKQNWRNPEEFRPERFQEEGAEEYNFKFLPFSAGPRNCIGKRFAMAEMKIAIYNIVLNFKVEVVKEIENPHRFAVFVNKDTEFKFTQRDN